MCLREKARISEGRTCGSGKDSERDVNRRERETDGQSGSVVLGCTLSCPCACPCVSVCVSVCVFGVLSDGRRSVQHPVTCSVRRLEPVLTLIGVLLKQPASVTLTPRELLQPSVTTWLERFSRLTGLAGFTEHAPSSCRDWLRPLIPVCRFHKLS